MMGSPNGSFFGFCSASNIAADSRDEAFLSSILIVVNKFKYKIDFYLFHLRLFFFLLIIFICWMI